MVAVIDETGEEVPLRDNRLYDFKNGRMHAHHVKQCNCVERNRISKLFQSSRITEQFQSVGFRDFVIDGRPACVKEARDLALDYYKTFDDIRNTRQNSCMFLGPPGSGKTHLLIAISNGLMRNGISVHYFPWVEGMNELKDDFSVLEKKVRVKKECDVLFVDDVYKGRITPTAFQAEQLFGVVNYRYMNCKPMLISSERTIDELFGLDEGIARRMHERSKGHRVEMGLTDKERAAGMELNYSLVM